MNRKKIQRRMVAGFLLVVSCLINGTKFASRVLLGATGTFRMTCNVTEIDTFVIYNIKIRRQTEPGSNYTWETIAEIETGLSKSPVLDKDIVNDKEFFVAGSHLDKVTPMNTYLTLDMNKEKLAKGDIRDYRRQLNYKSSITGSASSVKRDVNLLIIYNKGVTFGVAIILITSYAIIRPW